MKTYNDKSLIGYKYTTIRRRIAGYPAGLEALCEMIKSGDTDSKSFTWAMHLYGFTEDMAWEIYQDWFEGKIHPKAREIMQQRFGLSP